MSFGDITAHSPPRATPSPLPSSYPSPSTQIQGSFNALAANNAALRRLSRQLRSPDPALHPSLKCVRALREQNREIARAAATFAARLDVPAERARFQRLIEDFQAALKESVEAEREALQKMSSNGMGAVGGDGGGGDGGRKIGGETELTESQVAMGDIIGRGSGRVTDYGSMEGRTAEREKVWRTRNEQAVLREIETNDAIVRERNAVLRDIQNSVDDVNSIFKDLAVMIADQRAQVEYVEVNVGESMENVDKGNRELVRTQERRERRRGTFFCLLMPIAILIALFLIVLLS